MKSRTPIWLRLLIAGMLISLSVAPLFATGQTEKASSTGQEVTPINWYINLTWYKYPGDWGKDKFSQLVESKYGLKLNFVVPAQEGGAQISTMIASGTLPDVVTVESWLDYRSKMAKAGLLSSYDDLISKYDPSFKDILKMDIFNWYKESDGKTYGLPNFAYSSQDLKQGQRLPSNAGFVYRTDLYDRIGQPKYNHDPEQFLNVLQKVKDTAGTYQGKPVIPLQLYEFSDTGNLSADTWIPQYFATPFEDKNGNYLYARTQPQYFEGIRFLNEAYNRGLISPENFSDTRDQINEKVASGRVFALLAAPQDFMQQFKALYQADNNATYEGFYVHNYEGDDPVLADIAGFGWLTTSVAKSAKVPEKIIKFLHFLYSDEGQKTTFFGWEGETFNWTDSTHTKIEWTPAYQQALKDNSAGAKWGMGFMPLQNWLYAMDKMPATPKWSFDSGDEYRMKSVVNQFSWDGKARALKFNPDDPRNNDMQTLSTKINLYWAKQLPKMITAPSVDLARAIWEQSINDIKGMGLDKLVSYDNDEFQAAKKALGYKFAWPPNMKN